MGVLKKRPSERERLLSQIEDLTRERDKYRDRYYESVELSASDRTQILNLQAELELCRLGHKDVMLLALREQARVEAERTGFSGFRENDCARMVRNARRLADEFTKGGEDGSV